ncbi:indole-3-glycerol phosphate synthase TrpC [bacterium]|nr:indole-3-glycerol phosphate synthase TrpC [bacterium]
MNNILSTIIERTEYRIQTKKSKLPLEAIKEKISTLPPTRNFSAVLEDKQNINLICEVKKASPSKGLILKDYDPVKIAKIYEESGAKAISVLTESDFFLGSLNDLKDVKNNTSVPILRKDFIIDPYQIYESKFFGADCILLIARILEKKELTNLIAMAKNLNLCSLVEVHSKNDLKKAIECEAENIGINNRNLDSLKVNIKTSLSLFPLIPVEKRVVSESGIKGKKEIETIKNCGINSFLIGESLLTSSNIKDKIKELLS